MTDADFDRLTALYSNEPGRPSTPTGTKWYWAIKHAGGDQINGCPARRLARWITEAGQDVFWYHFTATSKSLAKDGFEGASGDYSQDSCEGCEMPYVFGNRLAKSERTLSKIIQGYWLSFAAGLKPVGRIVWPHYNLQDEFALALGNDVHVQHHPLHAKCEFWDGFFSKDWHPVSLHLKKTKLMAELQQKDKLNLVLDHLWNNPSISSIIPIFFFSLLSVSLCMHVAARTFRCTTVASTIERHEVAALCEPFQNLELARE
eukprot:gnl/TRDRNA2_/TRDRNA2_111734_c1_seq1.p1 gnl/TRDRNA2_/TRDRNA2_111734_c1~~gnl/TRDRNA2_/TRDRNA2_111734_c1_seq1.p1  ORF type:complete len:260 (-),score=17.59 gnl/TRDRNA2_/TRDRNA2_111734_c1_seq1:54-833(-)